MSRVLSPSFFRRSVVTVARDLLGKFLVRRISGREIAVMITETEAYDGSQDRACHAHRGRTPRNAPMFGPARCWYVYFVYGMHWMLNVVTGESGYPAAVLIRGAGEWEGPGKLTKALQIDGAWSGKVAEEKSDLWIEDRGVAISPRHVQALPRVGVDYAGSWARKPWRFVLRSSSSFLHS